MILLAVSVLLALLPLAGVAWIISQGMILTVDGIFTSLLLLLICGVFLMNGAWESRRLVSGKKTEEQKSSKAAAGTGATS
jgi:hypothetical protein